MKEVKSFTIDRKKWLQGEGSDKSYLVRKKDGKQCCLGFYLRACGFKKNDLINLRSPTDILDIPNWLKDPRYPSEVGAASKTCEKLFLANDAINRKKTIREKIIKDYFESVGIKVSFKGEY